ncbi:MAG TPA: Rieske 2Fe-2S domain-containing protein [Candidatus Nanopelagicales bacterium]|jgi:ubiquinol-cytochrome c reductase iron-sulfur subunit
MSDEPKPGTDVAVPESHLAPLYPLPAHHLRITDTDAKAAKRAERQVATMFILSALLVIGFVVAYFTIPIDQYIDLGPAGTFQKSNLFLGLTFGGAIFLIGAGAIHWAKKLMVDEEMVQQRHSSATDEATRAEALADFQDGTAESGFTQRPLLRRTLIGAMAMFPIPLVVLLKDMGPPPGDSLRHTIWKAGERIVTDNTLLPVRATDMIVGGLVSAQPESLVQVETDAGNLNARAKAAIILVRMTPGEIRAQQGVGWDYQGILAYSKICTHVGCPIALYQQRSHHLLCPCHQSTFDLADAGVVVFGPANRALPQLPITVDSEGYLVARSDFQEPVGPSFWERG